MSKNFISGYNIIRDNSSITREGISFNYGKEGSFSDFIKSLYQSLKIDYPKFYKMDNLCKLAFVSSEILLKEVDIKGRYKDDQIGIVIENGSSSIDSDSKHVDSFIDKSNYYPSPSIFVYTLPNIAIGEICIRNSIKGENALFIFEKFDIEFLVNYIDSLILSKKIEVCIGGWIEYSESGYESFLFLVEDENKLEQKVKNIPFTTVGIKKIYFNN